MATVTIAEYEKYQLPNYMVQYKRDSPKWNVRFRCVLIHNSALGPIDLQIPTLYTVKFTVACFNVM